MLTDSLAVWDRSADLAPLRLAITTLILAAQAGGARARAIDNVVASLHDRLTLGAEVRAHSAQAVLSAMTMSVLPVVFIEVSSSIDPDVGRVLLTTRTGLVCLVGGLVLDAAGAVWMVRIVGRVR